MGRNNPLGGARTLLCGAGSSRRGQKILSTDTPIVRGRATPSRTLQVRSRSAVVAHGRSRLIRRSGPPYGRAQDAGVIEVVKQTDTDGSRIGDGFPGNDPSTIEVA